MDHKNVSPERITLVTCLFQQEQYIESTIRSVIGQNYPSLEYVIVDGASTDGTEEILARYRDQCTNIIREPDSGETDALIKGFDPTSGSIMGRLCSDDLLLPGAL